MITKQFKTMSIKDLIPYENNPRINDDAVNDVIASIEQCENLDPIEIDEDNVILSGHTRLKALKKLKYKETEVLQITGLTDEQKRKYRILANKTGERAEWDLNKLEVELENLNFDGYDFGFDGVETTSEDVEPVEDDYEEELPEQPKTKRGDIYQLGRHRLICGDSTDLDTIKALMGGEEADLFITDPPYNVNYEGKTGLKIQNDNMEDAQFQSFLRDAFATANAVMKPGAAFYIWHADSEGYNFRHACKDVEWKVRQCLIWVKNTFVLGRQDYQWKHEPCLYGWKDGAAHYFIDDRKFSTVIEDEAEIEPSKMKKDELVALLERILAEKISTTVLYEQKPARNAEHPTMKPVRLIARLIKNSSRPNEKVLDLFGGSGSTLIAAEQLSRSCCMCELDEKYCDVIIDRWEKFTGKKAVLIEERNNTGKGNET